MKILLFLCALAWQAPKSEEKEIVAKISEFHTKTNTTDGTKFNKLPQNSKVKYFLITVDNFSGKPKTGKREVTEEVFYTAIKKVFGYGLLDSTDHTKAAMNQQFTETTKMLLREGILNKECLRELVAKYVQHGWRESLYFLDEAMPGIVKKNEWEKILSSAGIPSVPYGIVLTRIKLAKINNTDIEKIREDLDSKKNKFSLNGVNPEAVGYEHSFGGHLKAYAELVRKKPSFPKSSQKKLFSQCVHFEGSFKYDFGKYYSVYGLPAPSREIIREVFTETVRDSESLRIPMIAHFKNFGILFPKDQVLRYLGVLLSDKESLTKEDVEYLAKSGGLEVETLIEQVLKAKVISSEKPLLHLVKKFRKFKIVFPESKIRIYRDLMLQNPEEIDFADTEYLIKSDDGEIDPKLLKKCGDYFFSWHFRKENVHRKKGDKTDLFHAASECYRRLSLIGSKDPKLQVSKEKLKKMNSEYGDLSVRLTDLITIHKLLHPEDEAKDLDYVVLKLQSRITEYNKISAGAYYDAKGLISWHADQFGKRFILLRDEIELAAYLGNPKLTQEVTEKIAELIVNQIEKEGATIAAEYRYNRCIVATDYINCQGKLESSDTPAYENLKSIIDLFEYLDFKSGLYTLALALKDRGLDPVFRDIFIRLGMVPHPERWKNSIYRISNEKYWQEREARFNYEMRVYGSFDNDK